MAQWQSGDEVWAAKWGYPAHKIEVIGVRVASAGAKQATLATMHEALNYRTRITHDEGSRSKREALLVLKAATVDSLEAARASVLHAENQLNAVESALAALEKTP